jgi:biopolymer transport protein ExbD
VPRRRFKQEEDSASVGELNLVPYLDIMVNLIMFMLLTFQVLAELKIINFNPPASGSENQIGKQSDPNEKVVMLTVMITNQGYQILTNDDTLGKEIIPTTVTDGKKEHDYAKLTAQLIDIRKRLQVGTTKVDDNLIIAAEPDIQYDVVVKTLDATRTKEDGTDLFPLVTLGMALGTK